MAGGSVGTGARHRWPPRPSLSVVSQLLAALATALADAADRRRLFVLIPFSAIVGLALYVALPDEPPLPLYAWGSASGLLVFALALWARSLSALRLAVQLAAAWFGFCLLPLHAAAFGTSMLGFPAYGTYRAVVDEVLSSDPVQTRLIISHLEPQDGARPLDIRRARLSMPSEPRLAAGDTILAPLRLAPVPGPVLPGTHDSQFHSFFVGVGAFSSATGTVQKVAQGSDTDIARRIYELRGAIGARIDAVLEDDTAAIGKAMVVGDQSGITDETRDVMAASGLAHIYSISGLHLSIVAGGIFWLLRLALASIPALVAWPVKQIAAVAGIVTAFLYLLLAGGMDNVPAFRSTLMLALIFGAVLAGRRALTMRNVAIAAIVIIVIDPASVFRPSFQLSFAAVVGLIGIYEMPRRAAPPSRGIHRFTGPVIATGWTSFVAGLATLLFSAYHFQQTAPLGVAGNLLALPFVSFIIMPFGVLSVLAMPFRLDAPLIAIMGWGIDRMVDIAHLVAGWSQGLTGNPLLAGWTLLAALAALAWFAFIETYWRLLAPALLVPLVLALGLEPRPDILVSDTTQAIAISDGEGMALATGRIGSFAVDAWSRYYQTDITQGHPGARCDSLGCVVTTPSFSVAIVSSANAFYEDCGRHDLVIARVRPPNYCAAQGLVIAPAQLAQQGMHWLHWDERAGRFDIRPAMPIVNRPWRVSPR